MAKFVFDRKTQSAIDNTPRVKLVQKHDTEKIMTPLTLDATSEGVQIYGTMQGLLEDTEDLRSFAEAVSIAWMESAKMKRELRKVLSGK